MSDKVPKVPTSEDDWGRGSVKHIKHLEEVYLVEKRVYLMLTKGSTFLTIILTIK